MLLDEVRAKASDVLAAIRKEKVISEASEGKLKQVVGEFARTFA
jgi:hypothetical protein